MVVTVGESDVGLVVTGASVIGVFVCTVGLCDVGFEVTGDRVVW